MVIVPKNQTDEWSNPQSERNFEVLKSLHAAKGIMAVDSQPKIFNYQVKTNYEGDKC